MDRIQKGLFPQPRSYRLTAGECDLSRAGEVFSPDPDLPAEGYRLAIGPDRIRIAASGERGRFLAGQTLRQIRLLAGQSCPCLEIEDSPGLAVRCYMLDISRCRVPQMEHLFRLVDLLALFKYNQLQLYTEHTFAYAGHETVWREASPMTPEQVRELGQYCADRHIELVPNQNSFGHMERWLRHDAYRDLAECPDGFTHPVTGRRPVGSVLCPGREAADFVDSLLEQLLPCFQSDWIHLGCDEPWELGQGRSEDRVQEIGRHEVFREHVERLHALVARRGKRMLFWADELYDHPDRIAEFPQDIIPVVWGYAADHPFEPVCRAFADNGKDFLVAAGDSTWSSFTGRLEIAIPNIRAAVGHAVRFGARGVLLTSWGDNGHQQTWPTQLPAMAAFGAASWSQSSLSDDLALNHCLIAEALDRFVFQDSHSRMGNIWCGLARLDSGIKVHLREPIHSSFPFDALYAPRKQLAKVLRPSPKEAFFPVLAQLETFEHELTRTRCHCPDARWIMDEAKLAIQLTRFGLRRADAILKGHDPEAALAGLDACILRFAEIWLRRSREGGLSESHINSILRK